MFFGFMFVVVAIAGGLIQSSSPFARTQLTADLSASGNIVYVSSTDGFPSSGILAIGDERIAYSHKTSTTLYGIPLINPVVRGANSTTAAAHVTGSIVAMPESALANSSIDYSVALLSDSAGATAFLTVPTAVFSLLLAYGMAPLAFLGTGLQILTILWAVMFVGMIVSLAIYVAGGRRVA